MKLSIQRATIEKMLANRNSYLVLATITTLACVLQALTILLLLKHEKIVIVPPVVEKSFWVSGSSVSSEYLAEMTTFFAHLRLDITAHTASFQRDILLRYTDPNYYNSLKTQLIREEEKIKEQHLSIIFYPANIKVDTNKWSAIIEGDLKSFVGDTALPQKRASYLVTYRFDAGRLLVKSFEEVKRG